MKKHPLLLLGSCLFALSAIQLVAVPCSYANEGGKKAEKSEGEKGEGKKGEGEKGEKGEKKKGDDGGISGGRFEGDPIYVRIAPMVLPIITENGAEQLVTLVLSVQVNDFEAADMMHAKMPRVMDSLLRNLYGGLGQGTLRNGKLVNVNKIKSKAIDAVGEVIGKDKVHDVLIQGVAQRML